MNSEDRLKLVEGGLEKLKDQDETIQKLTKFARCLFELVLLVHKRGILTNCLCAINEIKGRLRNWKEGLELLKKKVLRGREQEIREVKAKKGFLFVGLRIEISCGDTTVLDYFELI